MKGTVERITSKQVNTKYGMKPAYKAKIGDTWVDVGFKKPVFNEGDEVEFEVVGQYNKLTTVTVLSSGGGGTGGSNAGGTSRDRVIVRQNALSHATALVIAMLPEKKPSSDVVAERVMQLAEKFEGWVLDRGEQEE